MNKTTLLSIALVSLCFVAPNIDFSEHYDEAIFVSECNGAPLATASYVPKDEGYENQQVAYSHLGDIESVWDVTKGEGITVAVIDSGINYNHPDFYNDDGSSILRMEDARYYAHVSGYGEYTLADSTKALTYFAPAAGKSYKLNGQTFNDFEIMDHHSFDTYGAHGTNVASVIASANNQTSKKGCVGIAPKVKILPIKVDFYMDSIGAALEYIFDLNKDDNPNNNVDIVNMSIESTSTYPTVTSYCSSLASRGVYLFAAAGNSNSYRLSYPAAEKGVIGVGALEDNSSTQKASYSNYNSSGITASSEHINVEISAPGKVYAADVGDSYVYTHGTSFASPLVAGAAALYKSINKDKTFKEFKTDLFASCDKHFTTDFSDKFGHGCLNVSKLLKTEVEPEGNKIILDVDEEMEVPVGEKVELVAHTKTDNLEISYSVLEDNGSIVIDKEHSWNPNGTCFIALKEGVEMICVNADGCDETYILVTVTPRVYQIEYYVDVTYTGGPVMDGEEFNHEDLTVILTWDYGYHSVEVFDYKIYYSFHKEDFLDYIGIDVYYNGETISGEFQAYLLHNPGKTIVSINASYNGPEIFVDDSLDKNNIKVTAVFEDEHTEIIDTNMWAYEGFNSSASGNKTLTISYKEFSCQLDVEVKTRPIINPPVVNPVVDEPTDTTSIMENNVAISGCGGSIVSASTIISLITLSGSILLLKKKQK